MRAEWPDEAGARRKLIETAREIWERGLGAAGDGNLSVRLGPDRVLTTPGGLHKGRLREQDIVSVDMKGRVLDGGHPSSELLLHLEAYQRRPEIGAVIHAHPPMALAFELAGGRLSELIVAEGVFAFGQVATAPYSTPTTSDVPAVLGPYLDCYDAIFMPRHGSVTLGSSLEQAFLRLDTLEHIAQIASAAKMMGGATPLPAPEVDRLYRIAFGEAQPLYRRAPHSCPPLEPRNEKSAARSASTGERG